jgi:hypothetical protein
MNFAPRLALAAALIAGASPAFAQEAKPAAPQAKPGEMQMSVITLTLLIKGTVLALHQANVTGNYSVLRDMGTPVFRERFDQAALTAAFANLRARKIDLSPAMLLAPNLTKNPELNKDGELVVTGNFPSQPMQIQFDLRFLQLDGVWRLAGLGVDAVPVPGSEAVAAAAPMQHPSAAQAPAAPKPAAASSSGAKKPVKATN